MKKHTLRGIIVLAVLLVLYLLVAFLVPFAHTAAFWMSFAFTLTAFGVAGAAIYIAFIKNPDAKSRFYGFPIAKIGAIYGLVQLIAGLVFMALAQWIAPWIPAVVGGLALGAAVLGLVSAEAVVEEIHSQDRVLKQDVRLMRALQSRVNLLASQCDDPEAAGAVKALAEELRYSDPVSAKALERVEQDLCAAVEDISAAVAEGDASAVKQLCRRAAGVLAERNRICKLSK